MSEEQVSDEPQNRDRRLWTNDSAATGEPTSLDVLLTWTSTSGNYNKYHGGPRQSGKMKKAIYGEIVALMNEKGIMNHDVRTRINEME